MNLNYRNLIKRLKEPSTYAGFAGLAFALGVAKPEFNAFANAAAAFFALVAVLTAEKGAQN